MKRWTLSVVVGSLLVAGCALDTTGLAPKPPGNQATGGMGGGQGGGGQGGGGQGGNAECTTVSDCPVPAMVCAAAACNNGVCEQVPGNVGMTCRTAVSNCDIAEVCNGKTAECPTDEFAGSGTACNVATNSCGVTEFCDGASANCAPDTGPAAACTPSLPITYVNLDRTFTITSVNLAGTGQTVATVGPGDQVTLQVGGTWQKASMPSCDGCLTQFYVALQGTFQDCVDVSGQAGMLDRNITFTAPTTPGVYMINPAASWQYKCIDMVVPMTFGDTTIATLVVK